MSNFHALVIIGVLIILVIVVYILVKGRRREEEEGREVEKKKEELVGREEAAKELVEGRVPEDEKKEGRWEEEEKGQQPEREREEVKEKQPEVEKKHREKERERKEKRQRIIPIRKGLEKTRGGFISRLRGILEGKKRIDPRLIEEIEELFIKSDIGVKTTQMVIKKIEESLSNKQLLDSMEVWKFIRDEVERILTIDYSLPEPEQGQPYCIMVVGVNGSGKTTTIGKLASRYEAEGKKVLLAAADTFRAAAVSQLEIWGRRVGCKVVRGKEGADPSSVIFDAVKRARQEGMDVVIADTAGRLHTKIPLMEELRKNKRVMGKALEGAPHEVLLVIDATTGQNGVMQAKSFLEALDITGIILTKLDGTAKGGVIISICNDMKIPVRYIGIGERAEDLRDFDPSEFTAALFDEILDKGVAA